MHNLDLISTARQSFRPQKSGDETISADQTDHVWDPEWSRLLFANKPNDNSSASIATTSLHKGYLTVTPLTIDATPLNYNTIFNEKNK